jgi:hypothetical protein
MRVFRLIVDCPVVAVRLDTLLARADAGSNGCCRILDAETRLIGTQTAQPIRIRIGPAKCRQRSGMARHSFRSIDELVELAFVGARPFHHPSGTRADVCEMFES